MTPEQERIIAGLVRPLAECPECRCKTFATIQEGASDEHRQGSRRRCVHCKLVIDDDADRARIAAALDVDKIVALVEAVEDVTQGRGMFGVDATADLDWALLHLEKALAAFKGDPT